MAAIHRQLNCLGMPAQLLHSRTHSKSGSMHATPPTTGPRQSTSGLSRTRGLEHYLVYGRPEQIINKWVKQITMLVGWHVSSGFVRAFLFLNPPKKNQCYNPFFFDVGANANNADVSPSGFLFLLFFKTKRVLLCLVVGGGGFQRPWDHSIQEILPSLRTCTNEAERTLDLSRRRSRQGTSLWLLT